MIIVFHGMNRLVSQERLLMKINYYYCNDDKTLAVTRYEGSVMPEGIDERIADSLIAKGFLNKSKANPIPVLTACSAPHGTDEPDDEVGREVARDKVLVKYYTKLQCKLGDYADALCREVDRVNALIEFSAERVENAESRLERY